MENKLKIPSVEEVMGKKRPEKKFRAGPISATIWANEGKNDKGEPVTFKSISFDRNYMDKEGNWQSTNSLRTNDLPKAMLVLSKAYEYVSISDDNTITEEL